METIIVEICIGVTGNVSDFMLPAHVPVNALIMEIKKLIEQVFPFVSLDDEMPLLCDREEGRIISGNITLAEAGIHDGSKLLLV